jgi:hypothetical protein
MSEEVTVVYKPLADLARWPRNPKAHDILQIRASLRRHGFVLPLVEDETSEQLVAGHGRLEALLQMQADGEPAPRRIRVGKDGGWSVPVVGGVAFANEREAEAYLLADNRLVEAGGWDREGLVAMLRDQGNLEGLGWTETELDLILADAASTSPAASTPADLSIRQLVLYYGSSVFDSVLERLERVMTAEGVDNHTLAFMKLLEASER